MNDRKGVIFSLVLICSTFLSACNSIGFSSPTTPTATTIPSTSTPFPPTLTPSPTTTITTTPTLTPTATNTPTNTPEPKFCPEWPEELDIVPNGYAEDYMWNENGKAWLWASSIWKDYIFTYPASILEGYSLGISYAVNEDALCPNMFKLIADIVGPTEYKNPVTEENMNFSAIQGTKPNIYQIFCVFCYPNEEGSAQVFSNYRDFSDPRRMCLAMEEATVLEPYYGLRALGYSLDESLQKLSDTFGDPSKSPYCSNLDPNHPDYLILYKQVEEKGLLIVP